MADAKLLRGAPVARRLRQEILVSAELFQTQFGERPRLISLSVGSDDAATAYRDSIDHNLRRAGLQHHPVSLAETTGSSQLLEVVRNLNEDPAAHGILLLMPLPAHISLELVMEHLSPMKDVDGITPTNAGRLHLGLPALRPSTPQGGIELLDHYGIPIAGRRAVVVGRSNVVGKPLASLLLARDATVTVCHRQTPDLTEIVGHADIVALAAGEPRLLAGDALRQTAVVVDFGINLVEGRLVGDADAVSVIGRVAAYTPVPGGTGPVTTMVLARNTVAAAFASKAGDPP